MTLFHLHYSHGGAIATRADLSTDEGNRPMCSEIKIGLTEERGSQIRFITAAE
jgi:hypothetical protein